MQRFVKMSLNVINFNNAKLALNSKKEITKNFNNREKTKEFANEINALSSMYDIDPVHQATLLMAKAIDVLVQAGPVPADLEEQNARAKNLLQSIVRARADLMEKSVRIILPSDIYIKKEIDEVFV